MTASPGRMSEQGQPLLHLFQGNHADSEGQPQLRETKNTPSSTNLLQVISNHFPTTGVFGSFLMLVLPRWIIPKGQASRKLHSTSWLDALRGYAAWFVVNTHAFVFRELPLFQLPFFNCFLWGQAAVDVFFVISGYVLTQRMLQRIRSQQKGKVMDALASSIFRRWIRLFAPCAAATFFAMLLVHWRLLPGPHVDGFFAQLRHWVVTFARFSDPFVPIVGWWHRNAANNPYIDFLWTIPVEYRGSLTVYLFVAATAKMQSLHRLLMGALLVVVFFSMQNIHGALFLSGTCLAEISLIRFPERYEPVALPETVTDPASKRPPTESEPSRRMRLLYGLTFITGLFLSGFSGYSDRSHPIYSFLQPLTPVGTWDREAVKHFWPSIAALMMVWSIDSWRTLQKPLNSRFSQILGELSFGLYVMQQLVLNTLYHSYLLPLFTSHSKSISWWIIGTLGTFFYWFVVAWAADCFDRVDRRIVKATRALQDRLFSNW